MTRAEAAEYLGQRLGVYLSAVGRTAADSAGNLASVIDDALRALGTAAADLATADPAEPDDAEDFRVQLVYRATLQIVRDLAMKFDVSFSSGDAFKLSQQRAAALVDLELASAAVLERFGTLGVVSSDGDALVTMDLNFLVDDYVSA